MVSDEKSSIIPQHHQNVLINGVNMEQIMLHLTNDVPEHPEIATEHRGLVHQPKGMRDAFAFLQNFEKSCAVDWVISEFGIHDVAHVVKCAKRFG